MVLAVRQKRLAQRKAYAVARFCPLDKLNLRDRVSGLARSIRPLDALKSGPENDLYCSLSSIQLAPEGIVAPGVTSRVRSRRGLFSPNGDDTIRDFTLNELVDVGHRAPHRRHHGLGDTGADVFSQTRDLGFHGGKQAVPPVEWNAADGIGQVDLQGAISLAVLGKLDERLVDHAIGLTQGM